MGIVRYSITLLDPKKRSPSRLRLGDCGADPRSVTAKVIQSAGLQPLSMIRFLFSRCYHFNFTVRLSQIALASAELSYRVDDK